MSIRVQKELSHLFDLLSNLGKKEVSAADQKIIERAKAQLEELKKSPSIESMQDLIEGVRELKNEEINKVLSTVGKILKIGKVKIPSPFLGKKRSNEEPVKLAFYSDIDCTDYNGAINGNLIGAIEQKIPFITSRALLRVKLPAEVHLSKVEVTLLKGQEDWEVFQKGEFVIFIPKTIHPELSGSEKLEILDFKGDGSIKKIALKEAFREPNGTPDFKDFTGLFVQEPKREKLIYFSGHGGSEAVGSLESEHYKQFLSFLGKQHCLGLTIWSCSSGGMSTLLSLPSEEEAKPHPYPIIVRSSGDFPTMFADKHLDAYFKELTTFVRGAPTISRLQKTIQVATKIGRAQDDEKIESERKKKGGLRVKWTHSQDPTALVKVFFPHSGGAPGGYRTVDESTESTSLTFTQKQVQQIEAQEKGEKGLVITKKNYLCLHPLVLKTPLAFKTSDPQLISMTPGVGHHLLSSVHLTSDPKTYLLNLFSFYEKNQTQLDKGFFIGKLSGKGMLFEEVAIKITEKGSTAVYNQGVFYFKVTKKDPFSYFPESITPLQHALAVMEFAEATKPTTAAVRATSAGQEEEGSFQMALRGDLFWSSKETLERASLFDHRFREINLEYMSDVPYLVFCLLENGNKEDAEYALKLLQRSSVEEGNNVLNVLNVDNTPLIFAALNHPPAFRWLLQNGEDVNVCHPYNSLSLLDHAVIWHKPLLDDLLNHPTLQINQPNQEGKTAVFYVSDSETLEKLKSKGADINFVTAGENPGETPLSECVKSGNLKMAKLLLENGADPHVGTPSALSLACKGTNLELVKLLIQMGGKPFEMDRNGQIPAIQAMLSASSAIVKFLLERKDCDLEIKDNDGLNLALAAAISGHPEKIETIQAKGGKFPQTLSENAKFFLSITLDRYDLSKDDEAKDLLLKWNQGESVALDHFITTYLPSQF